VEQSAPGRIRLGAVLLVLVAVAAVYLAIKFVPPYWTYLGMLDPVKEAAMAMVSEHNVSEASVRAELIRRAKTQDLTLENDDIDIAQDGTMLVVQVTWVTPVELLRHRYDLHFQIEERVPLR
jgi:cadmium resistance protein CadD (predicted permease)